MILRSEKRRLLGMEASGTKAAELGPSIYTVARTLSHPFRFSPRTTYQGYFAGAGSVIALNPFQIVQRLNGRLGSIGISTFEWAR